MGTRTKAVVGSAMRQSTALATKGVPPRAILGSKQQAGFDDLRPSTLFSRMVQVCSNYLYINFTRALASQSYSPYPLYIFRAVSQPMMLRC